MIILFSQRHKKALKDRKLSVTISKKIRQKLIYCMQSYNRWYGWDNQESIFYDDLKKSLLKDYGSTSLKAFPKHASQDKDVYKETDDIEEFILGTIPESVLDSIELYSTLIDKPGQRANFYKECNSVFKSEDSPFRILDGQVVKLDSDFLESEVLNKAFELLSNYNFEKACKDFLNARNNLTSGDYSGTITEANNAIESALKKALNKEKGEQGDLKKWLMKSGMVPDYFQGFCDHFEGLLQSAFAIANESSRHGKKEIPKKKNEIDYAVASFFLHLTGTLLVFIMERYQESSSDEDIPF